MDNNTSGSAGQTGNGNQQQNGGPPMPPAMQPPNGILKNSYNVDAMSRVGQRWLFTKIIFCLLDYNLNVSHILFFIFYFNKRMSAYQDFWQKCEICKSSKKNFSSLSDCHYSDVINSLLNAYRPPQKNFKPISWSEVFVK